MKMKNNCNTSCARLSAIMLSAACLAAVAWGCVNDNLDKPRVAMPEDVAFRAMKSDGNNYATRAGEEIPIRHNDFGNTVFYIYEKGIYEDKSNNQFELKTSVRPFWLESGNEGELALIMDQNHKTPSWGVATSSWEMNWFAADTEHRFWSWTWPMDEEQWISYGDVNYSVSITGKEAGKLDETVLPIDKSPESKVLTFISSDFPPFELSTDTATRSFTRGDGDDGNDNQTGGDGDGDGGDGGGGDGNGDGGDDVNPTPGPVLTEEQRWRNGEALERLIGARTDRTYVFNQDGKYVPLNYKHLVSKIILGDFWLVDNTGATQKDLKAKITFYGLPKRAMFYPLPKTTEVVDGVSIPKAPYVTIDHSNPYGNEATPTDEEMATEIKTTETGSDGKPLPFDYNLRESLTFYVMNRGEDQNNSGGVILDDDPYANHDVFYICPEVDFSQLEYKVEFWDLVLEYAPEDKEKKNPIGGQYQPHGRYGQKGGFFGDFKSVKFVREGLDAEGQPTTQEDRVLHAGEVMVLNMTVYEKSGPGTGVYIRNWDSEKLKSATHHTRKGIYSDAEAKTVRDALVNNTTANAQKESIKEKFIEEEELRDDEGNVIKKQDVIRLYSDVMIAKTSKPFDFCLYYPDEDNDIVLDGMGYTITFINNSSTNKEIFETFKIGNMRDVYISNGIYTVYIDPEGRLCRWDKETERYVVSESENPWTRNTKEYPFETPEA